jgi:hypothetical protein
MTKVYTQGGTRQVLNAEWLSVSKKKKACLKGYVQNGTVQVPGHMRSGWQYVNSRKKVDVQGGTMQLLNAEWLSVCKQQD